MKIMIVDDSKIVRGKISQIVKQSGDHGLSICGMARNGREAIQLCRQTMPDIATMDLTMPEIDGVESITELVQINPDILILVISALADKGTAIEALKRGAHGFLCKPFSEDELTEALNELICAGEEA